MENLRKILFRNLFFGAVLLENNVLCLFKGKVYCFCPLKVQNSSYLRIRFFVATPLPPTPPTPTCSRSCPISVLDKL
jgi:hypothetical protein